MDAAKERYTADELERLPEGKWCELLDGRLRPRTKGAYAALVGTDLLCRVFAYCEENRLGWVVSSGAGYNCFAGHPNTVRRVSVSLIRFGRFPDERLPWGHSPIPPDFAAEMIGPMDDAADSEEKVAQFMTAGTRLFWVIDSVTRTVRIHRADGTVADVRGEAALEGEDAVPGFRCQVAELFRTR